MKYDYSRLPAELKGLGHVYGLYRKKGLAPISAAEYLIGNRVPLKVNDKQTLSSFEDAMRAYLQDTTGEIQGIMCVLRAEHKLFVVDLDKPKSEEDFNRRKIANLTYAQYCEYHKADVMDMVKEYGQGTFIERSRSKEGFHVFFTGEMPTSFGGYNGKFVLGDVFTKDQAIFLTADFPIGAVTRLAGQRGVDKILGDIKDSLQVFTGAALIGTIEAKTEANGRALNLTDEQVLERYFQRNKEHREIYEGTRDLYGTSGNNWSEGTDLLQKELDKITGDPDQIYRVMFGSPRLRNAGKASNGVDRAKRTDKYFDKRLAGARAKNDQWFAQNGGNPYANRQAALAHGADMFGRMGGVVQPTAPTAAAPPPVATMSRDDRLVAAGATERFNAEGEAYWTIGDDDNRKFIGKTPADLDAWLIVNAPEQAAPPAPPPIEISKAPRFTPTVITALQQIIGDDLPPEYLKFHEPPGLLGEACRMAAKGMYEPLPFLAVPATIVAMAGIVSQTYKYHGSGLNVMFVAGAKTGVGKTQAADVWNDFIDEILQSATGQDELLHAAKNRVAPFAFASKQGAHSQLQKRSCFAWFNDECETLLDMMENRTDPLALSVQNIVLKMFEISKDSTRLEPEDSRTGQNMKDRVLRNVSISSFWATTIATLRLYLQPDFLAKGFGSRLMFLLYKGVSGVEQDPKNILRKLPEGDLRRTLKTLLRMAQETESLYQSFPASYMALEPEEKKQTPIPEQQSHANALIHVTESPEAEAFMKGMRTRVGVFKRGVQDDASDLPEYYSMLSRLALIAPRIASIMAVLENPTSPVITLPQAYYSYGYCLQIMGETLSAFDTNELGVSLSSADMVVIDVMKKLIRKDHSIASQGIGLGVFKNAVKKRAPFLGLKGRDAQTAPDIAISHCQAAGYLIVEAAQNNVGMRGRPGALVKITDNQIWDELFSG